MVRALFPGALFPYVVPEEITKNEKYRKTDCQLQKVDTVYIVPDKKIRK